MPSNDGAGAPLLLPAPGGPGVPARWTSSAKSGVGTAPGIESRVWFSISHGILNEVYYPRVDRACTRDLGFIVTGPDGFFSEEKRHATHAISRLAQGVPAFQVTNTCNQGRYILHKELLTDPVRDVLLQEITFEPRVGTLGDYRVHPLLASHLGNQGNGNSAWLGDYKGVQMLFAQRDGTALALAASVPWKKRAVGFVGESDGFRQLKKHGQLLHQFTRADDGNVALCGELDLTACDGKFLLALSFGQTAAEAAHHALTSLWRGFAVAREKYLAGWGEAQRDLEKLDEPVRQGRNNYRVSTSVLRTHESKEFHGGIIASLSVPWGASKGDGDLGGYHLAWPRDLVETAGGLLAAGAHADARRVLRYLAVTQEADGHWPQNLWLDGTPYWSGIQMDETALPILLVDLALRERALTEHTALAFWPVVKRAAGYLVQNGPVTQEDRWEEDGGYSPFTLAAEIAALLAAADLADLAEEGTAANYLRETADTWNSSVERWCFVRTGSLGKSSGLDAGAGYYVRTAPDDALDETEPDVPRYIPIKNRLEKFSLALASEIVSPDALALVRFGLRAADDPRIVSTVKVIDALLKTDFETGPCWRRYNEDGYGEHEDGAPFDGVGIGRPWPLLTGERAHYELALGNQQVAESLLLTFESFASDGGLFPEQIWDQEDLPKRELFRGKPSGSAMPLVWAHSEHIKLLRSLRDGKVFDMPPQTVQRYQVEKVDSPRASWRFNHKLRRLPQGKLLRIETQAPARIRFTTDGWSTNQDLPTRDSGLGMHFLDLPSGALKPGAQVVFTFYWPEVDRWEGVDFSVNVSADPSNPTGVP
jgi:glucoamylase